MALKISGEFSYDYCKGVYEQLANNFPCESCYIDAYNLGTGNAGACKIAIDQYKESYLNKLSTGEFVDHLYKGVLTRTADKGGKKFWVDNIGSTFSRKDAFYRFLDSEEFKGKFSGYRMY